MVHLVEHELLGDGRLGAVNVGGAAHERRDHLLHHLVEEDVGQLGMEEGAELEGDLGSEENVTKYLRHTASHLGAHGVHLQRSPQWRYEDIPGGRG